MDPSLLEYARFHGIASDYLAINPLTHVDDTFGHGVDDLLPNNLSRYSDRLQTARSALKERIRGEKIRASKGSARFLTALIREAQTGIVVNWDDILPEFHRYDAAVESPIFSLQRETDVNLSRSRLRYVVSDIELPHGSQDISSGSGPSPLDRMGTNGSRLLDEVKKNDRVRCSKQSFSLIQTIRSNAGPSVKELEDILGMLLKCVPVEPESDVLPLTADYLPPSPTPAPEDHMLPSPVSAASIEFDLFCRKTDYGKPMLDHAFEKTPLSFGRGRDIQYERVDSPERASPSQDKPVSDSVLIVEEAPSPAKFNNTGKDLDEKRAHQLASANEGHMSKSDAPQKRAATPVAKQLSQKRPKQEPSPKSLHGSHDAKRKVETCQQRQGGQPPRVNLGSLSSFMETRGKSTRKQISAESPYFPSKDGQGQNQNTVTKPPIPEPQAPKQKPDIPTNKSTRTPSFPVTQVPRVPPNHEGLVLFISTALLKSHLRIIQCLEGAEHPPKLIYRDYHTDTASNRRPRPQSKAPAPLPAEADIILSPQTGICLATSQATMQLYLPGHKPTCAAGSSLAKTINSPLRESIFRLAPRYAQLYVFIAHNPDQSKRSKARASNPQLTVDKALNTALTSLSAFCASLADYSCVVPLLVPSVSESISAWILALAHKHICRLPPAGIQTQSQYRIAFTPVNPRPQLVELLGDTQERVWEGFLRRTGLNPYAAQVVLAVLRREYGGRSGLSRFVEMSGAEREKIFSGLLGDKVLKRVAALIEMDWQCDWALNFGDGIN
ncbi:uncharacterized protein DSM5745_05868 [Aspergillus mulundensis]|uniref:Uncharacterized protein n=1 Tax=Aspergillus mulundensis TaxID=1810919 RepID=A0A3D8RYB9_9EURO|nr:hypothetical protein DSM5745_05868 [Aspergillus mulundensis]RDW79016.1 hypothetical protein DSM5745_05868 [Aspergillus mulundensis]